MANLVPAFIGPELYLPVSRVVQRPPHRLVRLLHPRNIHARREGIMKAHDGGFNAPRHGDFRERAPAATDRDQDRKSTRLNSSHSQISYAVFCLKKKNNERVVMRAVEYTS